MIERDKMKRPRMTKIYNHLIFSLNSLTKSYLTTPTPTYCVVLVFAIIMLIVYTKYPPATYTMYHIYKSNKTTNETN